MKTAEEIVSAILPALAARNAPLYDAAILGVREGLAEGRREVWGEESLSFCVLSDLASRECETLGSKVNEECGETVPYCLPCRARNAIDSVTDGPGK